MSLRPTSPTRPVTPDCPRGKQSSKFGVWQKLQHFFGRDGSIHAIDSDDDMSWTKLDQQKCLPKHKPSSPRPTANVGLPRQATFKRTNSEKRDRLCRVEPLPYERRAYSTSRPAPCALVKLRSNSLPATSLPMRRSAPVMTSSAAMHYSGQSRFNPSLSDEQQPVDADQPLEYDRQRPSRPASITSSSGPHDDYVDRLEDRAQLNRELDTKWILNLSMHFRDKSDREKFFVTFAETPTRWRRVTVSCDYRNAEPGSLEVNLKELQLQRDKSMQIYEAVRDSLPDIKFYDTVTNLKFETSNGRLHVHVTEDVNEIIPYPPITSLQHLLIDSQFQPRQIRESELSFESHLSGFVYKVMYNDMPYIKKEIPGPDTVDEFLYEVNALHALHDSQHVIDLEGIITDESGQLIKGLLINYAESGALVDLLYDFKGDIAWERRERWARNAIQGLSNIHEDGYVQGDFTLSNIVVDIHDNARIIDINRRGCPVGWEPPEIAKKIASNQRISMYIGQKSDLYQLGMTLWALAMDDDEPERHDPPLSTQEFPAEVPAWFQDVVRICLSVRPRDRLSATDLMKMFPTNVHIQAWSSQDGRPLVRIRNEKQYIDPAPAVDLNDLQRYRHEREPLDDIMYSPESSRDDPTFTWPQSSDYDREYNSTSSDIERPRGRRRISDQDLAILAQDRTERALVANEDDESNGVHHRTPIISISSDRNACRLIDNDGEESPIEVIHTIQDENLPDVLFPDTGSSLSAHHLSDRRLFPSYSETSEDTPRDSSLQLFSSGVNSPHRSDFPVQSGFFPDELTGLGSHPNVSGHSLGHMRHEVEAENRANTISPLPSMPFFDSGYNEPSAFGLESDEQGDVQQKDSPLKEDLYEHQILHEDSGDKMEAPLPTDEDSLSHQQDLKARDDSTTVCEVSFPHDEVPVTLHTRALADMVTESVSNALSDSGILSEPKTMTRAVMESHTSLTSHISP